MILGIDEVGRGAWAGPLVVGAVVLGGHEIPGLTDSKLLSKKRREALDVIIREQAAGYGLGWVSSVELDEIGLAAALRLATIRAAQQVTASYDQIILDGTVNFLKDTGKGAYVTTMKKADLLVPSVSAASIIAKVARDQFMTEQDDVHPGYSFANHVGYGTAAHRAAIAKLGPSPLHRRSFAPLKQYAPPTASNVGALAETVVAHYLTARGHEIIARNWRVKTAEIDIISRVGTTIYFTEVKYRRQPNQGGGFAAITPRKLKQMAYAAELFTQSRRLQAADIRLAAAAVTGEPPRVEDWLELL